MTMALADLDSDRKEACPPDVLGYGRSRKNNQICDRHQYERGKRCGGAVVSPSETGDEDRRSRHNPISKPLSFSLRSAVTCDLLNFSCVPLLYP